jgi:hypothetical protein
MNTTPALKQTLFNEQIAPGLHLYACKYRRRAEVKPDAQQAEFFAENDQRAFNAKVLSAAQSLFKIGDTFYPSDLREQAPELNPARSRTMWGPTFRHLLHNGFKLTMMFRKSPTKGMNGCREFQYRREA